MISFRLIASSERAHRNCVYNNASFTIFESKVDFNVIFIYEQEYLDPEIINTFI